MIVNTLSSKRTGISRFILIAMFVCLASGRAVRAEFETPIAITNAKIVKASGEVIESGTIVVAEGRIVAAGRNVTIPSDAEIFDATGLIVYPGFIDANTHVGIAATEPDDDALKKLADDHADTKEGPQPATMLAYRRLIHPHWRAEELFDQEEADRAGHRKAGFAAALVSPKSGIFAGSSAIISMGDAPPRRSVLRADMAQHSAFATGRRRGRGRFPSKPRYPTTTMGAIAAFRQVLLDSQWHRDLIDWSRNHPEGKRPPIDRDLEALWSALDGRTRVAFVANGENEIHRALDAAAEFDLKPIIVGAREGWKVADRLKREDVPVIVSLKWSDEPETPKSKKDKEESESDAHEFDKPWLDRRPLFDKRWQEQMFETRRQFDERKRLWGEEVDNALRLHEADVRFGFASFELESVDQTLERLRKAVERGLPEEAAIAALTRDAAAVLGLDELIGEIAPGRLANLTLMDKPLSEKKSKVKWVFVEGKAFDASVESKGAGKKKGKGGRGGRWAGGGRGADRPDEAEKEGDKKTDESQPTSDKAEDTVDFPEFACEIEADRKPETQTGGNLLIKNATLLTISAGDLVETDLLVQDGRITAIGGDLTAPPGLMTVDLRGYTVMPGMIDPHSHMCSDGGLNEFSLSVTPEVRVRDVVDHTDVSAYRALAGGITAIHTMHGSANTIGGQNVVLHLKYGRPAAEWRIAEAPKTVKFALGENVKQSNFAQRRGTRFPSTRMGVEAVLRRSFDAARAYAADRDRYEKDKAAGNEPRPLRRDLRLQALTDIHDGRIWVHCHCYRADEVLRLLSVAEEYGFRIGVLQHILEGYRVIPEMLRHGCAASTFSDWWAYKLEAYNAIPHNAARMIQGGVTATVNSDSAELIRHMNLEAAKSLRFGGLDANDALRLVTLNAAIQLGVDKYMGSIEAGKFADLAIFDGHPLDTLSKCVLTLIEGEIYFQHDSMDLAAPPAPLAARNFDKPKEPIAVDPSDAGEYWIVGGTIHPISGRAIENGELIIADGKIKRVGKKSGRTPPSRAILVDASGLHVYPGLINAGVPLGLTEIGSVAGSNDTRDIAKFQPDLRAVSAYNPFASAIGVARSEGITTALIPPAGGAVEGQAGIVHLNGWSMPEARIDSSVGLFVNLPSLPLRFPEWMPEEMKKERKDEYGKTMPLVEAYFRKAKQYARVSALAKDDPDLAPQPDRKLEAMIPAMRGEAPVFFRANSYKEIKEALAFAERYEVRPVIYGAREAWKIAGELSEKRVDVIIAGSMAYPAGEFEPWDSVYRNAAVLHEAGVRFCFAASRPTRAKHLGIEAGMAVAHGLDPDHAVRAITLDAAAILGMGDRCGSLESGKIADVIVTTDSPLQASNCVVASFVAGRPMDLSNKHTKLDEMFQGRPKPDLDPAPDLRGPPPMRLKSSS